MLLGRTLRGQRSKLARRVASLIVSGTMLAGASYVSVAAGGLSLPTAAAANAKAKKKDFSMSPWMAAQLTKAQEQLGEKKYKEALETLANTSTRGKLSLHEQGSVHQTEGYIWSAQSKYKKAAVAFEKTLATDMMPDQVLKELHYNLGQIYQLEKQYTKSLKHFLRWIATEKKPKGDDYYLIATSFLQADRKDRAIAWARKAVKTTSKPKENWLQLITSLLFEQKAYGQLPSVLNQTAALYPKKLYYDQLFAVYAKLKQYDNALAVLELAYKQDMLESSEELSNLAMLYIQNGVPLKGARVMEEGFKSGAIKKEFKTYQLHSECLLAARELDEALGPLGQAARAAKGTKNAADMYMRQAEIYVSKRRWDDVRKALKNAFATGKLQEKGMAYLLEGIANYRDQKKGAAKTSFQKARRIKSSRRAAKQWLTMLESQAS